MNKKTRLKLCLLGVGYRLFAAIANLILAVLQLLTLPLEVLSKKHFDIVHPYRTKSIKETQNISNQK